MVFDKKRAIESFATWLNERLSAHGVPERGRASWLAKRYKVSAPAARKWIDGTGMPDMAQFVVLVNDFGRQAATYDAISAGLEVLPGPPGVREPSRFSIAETPSAYVRLPLLAMEAGMGTGTEIDAPPEIIEHLDIARWWAESHLPRPISRVKLIVGRGDSNAPLINDGDIIFVDTARNTFDGEGFYVFNWQGAALVKRLVPDLRTKGVRIESANPNYSPQHVQADELEQLHIAGRVVAWYTLRRN